MKKIIKLMALFFVGFGSFMSAQTAGTLTFTFTTPKHATGNYVTDGRFVMAAWVETGAGAFVKTKMRYVGGGTDDHLPTWGTQAGCANPTAVTATTGCNTTDATTGATLTTFVSRTFTWDGKNVSGTANGTTVADGTYRVAIQETWGHGTSTATRYFTFTKGAAIDSQTPADDTNFTGITLKWVPAGLAVSESAMNASLQVFPNPTSDFFKVKDNSQVKLISIYNADGAVVRTFKPTEMYDLTTLVPGVYMVEILTSDGKAVSQKLIKK